MTTKREHRGPAATQTRKAQQRHAPSVYPNRAYCGATGPIGYTTGSDEPTCPNCAAAIRADKEARR